MRIQNYNAVCEYGICWQNSNFLFYERTESCKIASYFLLCISEVIFFFDSEIFTVIIIKATSWALFFEFINIIKQIKIIINTHECTIFEVNKVLLCPQLTDPIFFKSGKSTEVKQQCSTKGLNIAKKLILR